MPRIALIHALAHSPPAINAVMARMWPEAERMNLLDDSLSADLARAGALDAAMTARFVALADYAAYLDERALFRGQWGLSPGRTGPDYEELVETQGRPRLRSWLSRITSEGLLEAGVVYGYWPAHAEGNAVVIGDPHDPSQEIARFDFPRQKRGRHLCLADYVRPDADVIAMQIVTMGRRIDEAAAELFGSNSYRDYLELHGLSVQLTEALAEYWHSRVRQEWGIGGQDDEDVAAILKQKYRGERFSFGYPACPDLSQQKPLVELLGADRIGVTLSEEFQLDPEQSTSAIIFHHPEAAYFNAT